jgi:hypothetical protein
LPALAKHTGFVCVKAETNFTMPFVVPNENGQLVSLSKFQTANAVKDFDKDYFETVSKASTT